MVSVSNAAHAAARDIMAIRTAYDYAIWLADWLGDQSVTPCRQLPLLEDTVTQAAALERDLERAAGYQQAGRVGTETRRVLHQRAAPAVAALTVAVPEPLLLGSGSLAARHCRLTALGKPVRTVGYLTAAEAMYGVAGGGLTRGSGGLPRAACRVAVRVGLLARGLQAAGGATDFGLVEVLWPGLGKRVAPASDTVMGAARAAIWRRGRPDIASGSLRAATGQSVARVGSPG